MMYLSISVYETLTICFCLQQGTVLTPTMDHAMSIQPTSMMGPLTQQLSHLSLGSTGTVSTNHTPHTYTHQEKIVPITILKLSGQLLLFTSNILCFSFRLPHSIFQPTQLCRGPTSPSSHQCLPPVSKR